MDQEGVLKSLELFDLRFKRLEWHFDEILVQLAVLIANTRRGLEDDRVCTWDDIACKQPFNGTGLVHECLCEVYLDELEKDNFDGGRMGTCWVVKWAVSPKVDEI